MPLLYVAAFVNVVHSVLFSGQEEHYKMIEDEPFELVVDEATVNFILFSRWAAAHGS